MARGAKRWYNQINISLYADTAHRPPRAAAPPPDHLPALAAFDVVQWSVRRTDPADPRIPVHALLASLVQRGRELLRRGLGSIADHRPHRRRAHGPVSERLGIPKLSHAYRRP